MSVKMREQWDSTHLCRNYTDNYTVEAHCEYFLQTKSEDTMINGKRLNKWCYYCTSENKVRKIGSGGSWTGLSPKFCPKRKALEQNQNEPTEDDIALFKQYEEEFSCSCRFEKVCGFEHKYAKQHRDRADEFYNEIVSKGLEQAYKKWRDLKTAGKEEDNMARKMQFDAAITKDMKSAASDSFLDNIKMIDINEIAPSRNNFYEISDVELLADDIEREGLKHNLVVVKDSDTGFYEVKSGHRRLAAIKLLINEKRRTSTKIPCYVDGEKSAAESQFDLIMLNATQRKYSDADLMHEYENLTQTLKALNDVGKGIGGRMRENIARILNVSNGQVGKLDNIRNNAVSEVREAIKSGEMSISTANEIAKLAPEKQKEVVEKKPDITSAEVKQMQEKKPAAPKITEPDFNDDFDEDEGYEDDFDEDEDEDEKPESKPISKPLAGKSCSLSSAEAEVLLRYFDHLMYYTSDEDEAVLKKIREKMESCG